MAERAMLAEVDAAKEAGDSIGGSFVVVAEGMPIGLGSSSEWDTRLDGLLAGATMAIPGVKGVEIGLGFGAVDRRGRPCTTWSMPAVSRLGAPDATAPAASRAGSATASRSSSARPQKPVSTLRKPLPSLDMATGEPRTRAHRAERRHHPAARGDRGRGDGRARARRRAPLLVRRRHDRRPAGGGGRRRVDRAAAQRPDMTPAGRAARPRHRVLRLAGDPQRRVRGARAATRATSFATSAADGLAAAVDALRGRATASAPTSRRRTRSPSAGSSTSSRPRSAAARRGEHDRPRRRPAGRPQHRPPRRCARSCRRAIHRAVVLGGGGASRAAVGARKAAGCECGRGGRSRALGRTCPAPLMTRGPARQRHADRHRLRRDAGAGQPAAARPCGPRPRLSAEPDAPGARGSRGGRRARAAAPGCCSARPRSASRCGPIAQRPGRGHARGPPCGARARRRCLTPAGHRARRPAGERQVDGRPAPGRAAGTPVRRHRRAGRRAAGMPVAELHPPRTASRPLARGVEGRARGLRGHRERSSRPAAGRSWIR